MFPQQYLYLSLYYSFEFHDLFVSFIIFDLNIQRTESKVPKWSAISRDNIQSIYKSSFIKDRLVVGLSGDLDPNLAKKYVDYVFTIAIVKYL